MSDETVKLHITIKIDQEDPEVDTGVSVELWNAMSDHQRQEIVQDLWDQMAGRDDGGMRVVTPGARDI